MQYSTTRPYYPVKPQRRGMPRLIRNFFLLLLASPFLCVAWLAATSPSFRDAVGVLAQGGLSPAASFPGRSHIDLLVLGRDRDVDNHKRVLKTRGRSDLMMLSRLDLENRAAYVLSIPRDTWVRLPGSHRYGKINAAHAI